MITAELIKQALAGNNTILNTIASQIQNLTPYECQLLLAQCELEENKNNSQALNLRGLVAWSKRDCKTAIELFEKAIQLENGYAMFNRAGMYRKGDGGPVDIFASVKLYRQAYNSSIRWFIFSRLSNYFNLIAPVIEALPPNLKRDEIYYHYFIMFKDYKLLPKLPRNQWILHLMEDVALTSAERLSYLQEILTHHSPKLEHPPFNDSFFVKNNFNAIWGENTLQFAITQQNENMLKFFLRYKNFLTVENKQHALNAAVELFKDEYIHILISKHPELISNQLIQSLGHEYLIRYGTTLTLFHKNHGVAEQLKMYNEPSDARSKWLFLADEYTHLVNQNGNLAKKIRRLFETAFEMNGLALVKIKERSQLKLKLFEIIETRFPKQQKAELPTIAIVDPVLPPEGQIYPFWQKNEFINPPLPSAEVKEESSEKVGFKSHADSSILIDLSSVAAPKGDAEDERHLQTLLSIFAPTTPLETKQESKTHKQLVPGF